MRMNWYYRGPFDISFRTKMRDNSVPVWESSFSNRQPRRKASSTDSSREFARRAKRPLPPLRRSTNATSRMADCCRRLSDRGCSHGQHCPRTPGADGNPCLGPYRCITPLTSVSLLYLLIGRRRLNRQVRRRRIRASVLEPQLQDKKPGTGKTTLELHRPAATTPRASPPRQPNWMSSTFHRKQSSPSFRFKQLV